MKSMESPLGGWQMSVRCIHVHLIFLHVSDVSFSRGWENLHTVSPEMRLWIKEAVVMKHCLKKCEMCSRYREMVWYHTKYIWYLWQIKNYNKPPLDVGCMKNLEVQNWMEFNSHLKISVYQCCCGQDDTNVICFLETWPLVQRQFKERCTPRPTHRAHPPS